MNEDRKEIAMPACVRAGISKYQTIRYIYIDVDGLSDYEELNILKFRKC